MQRKLVVLLLVLFSFLIIGCNNNQVENKVIGLVNGTEITQAELDEYYAMIKTGYESQMGNKIDEKKDKELIDELKERAFEDLVLQTLVNQEAENKGIEITEEQIMEDLIAFKELHGDEGYNNFLKQIGMTENTLKEQIKIEKLFIALQDEITGDIKVTDEEVEHFYNENKELFTEPAGTEIWHILVETEEEAQEILSELDQGADFSGLAQEHSICPSKEEGGNLGLVNEESPLVEEFKMAALELKNGEITKDPVKTEFGYHIIKAGQEKEAETVPYETVKNDIAGQLEANKQNEVFADYLKGLRENAQIEDKR